MNKKDMIKKYNEHKKIIKIFEYCANNLNNINKEDITSISEMENYIINNIDKVLLKKEKTNSKTDYIKKISNEKMLLSYKSNALK